MLSKLFWKISLAIFIGFEILLTGCAKNDPSSVEANSVIAERLDLTEEQASRVQPVTAEIWAEREILRKLHIDLYDQILVQLKNESVDQEELQNMLYSSWNQMEPMIPKAVNAFFEYQGVLSEEKRIEKAAMANAGFYTFVDDQIPYPFGIKNMNVSAERLEWFLRLKGGVFLGCLLYTSPSPRDGLLSRMPSSA